MKQLDPDKIQKTVEILNARKDLQLASIVRGMLFGCFMVIIFQLAAHV